MTKIHPDDLLDDDFDPYAERGGRRSRPQPPKRSDARLLDELVEYGDAAQVGAEAVFRPTFTSSKHEREWILNFLGAFYDDRLIGDVLRKVKGGKEANVYLCQAYPGAEPNLIAAKVYRPRMFRQLRNDSRYRQGRLILDDEGKEVRDARRLHAVAKRTRFGQEVLHTSWLEHEYQTLTLLHSAGADVPRPLACGSNTILMEYIGEVDEPAPPLHHVRLRPAEARRLFERLMGNVETMLACGRVHADLSAYNVLYWNGEVKIIDFPQAVDVQRNPEAPDLLGRDIERLCRYFARYGATPQPAVLAEELWARHAGNGSAAGQARARALEEIGQEEGG
jgi:RIO kinase 1